MRSFTLDNLLRLCLSSLRPSRKGAVCAFHCHFIEFYFGILTSRPHFLLHFIVSVSIPKVMSVLTELLFSLGEQIVTLRKFYLVICFEFPSHDFLFSRSGWESSWWLPQPLAEPFQRGLESSRLMCPCSLRLWNARHREDISVGTLIICLSFSVVHSG